jgi:cation transport ATPase
MENFYGTLAVDSVGMGLAAFGLLNPLLAAFIHVASELIWETPSPEGQGQRRRGH